MAEDSSEKQALNPASIPVSDVARMLGLPEETLRRHIDDGAPVTPDGAMSLVHYAAWLNGPGRVEPSDRGDDGD